MTPQGLRYEGPIYRPPSEADSLLVQATIGCPHNLCTFCMVYKNGPMFRIRPVEEIKEDLRRARNSHGESVKRVFFPSGNTIIMPTDQLVEVLTITRDLFPNLERITIYASSQYIYRKGIEDMKRISEAGLSRVHVGLESGDAEVLRRTRKGSTPDQQIEAGLITRSAGIELSEYVVLGIGGAERTMEHIQETIRVLNEIDPDFIRIRTFLPKINTPILEEIENGSFEVLSPHGAIDEARRLIEGLEVSSLVLSDHYTNYIDIQGRLPEDRQRLLDEIETAMGMDESTYRPVYLGTQ